MQQKEGGLSVVLDMEAEEEVKQNVSIFSELGLIGRFCGIWPSLSELHSWISENWGPLITGNVQIYPAAKGFFIVVFGNIEDKKMVLCDHFWCWEDQNVLMLKPWHPKFRPDSESFEKIPIWVRLPYFPLHLWFNSCLETIENSLGEFLLVDEGSSNLLHSTYAQILVEMNISLGLPADIEIKTSNGSWFQPLDYEGIPFRCRRCHQVGHLAAKCSKVRVQRESSWWKNSEEQHYTVVKKVEGGEEKKSFSQIVADSPHQISPAATNVPQNLSMEEGKGKQQAVIGMDTPARQEKHKHHEKAAAQVTQLKKRNEGVLHSHKETTWQMQAARVEDGWQVVKGKKERRGAKESFEMVLRSQSRGRGKA